MLINKEESWSAGLDGIMGSALGIAAKAHCQLFSSYLLFPVVVARFSTFCGAPAQAGSAPRRARAAPNRAPSNERVACHSAAPRAAARPRRGARRWAARRGRRASGGRPSGAKARTPPSGGARPRGRPRWDRGGLIRSGRRPGAARGAGRRRAARGRATAARRGACAAPWLCLGCLCEGHARDPPHRRHAAGEGGGGATSMPRMRRLPRLACRPREAQTPGQVGATGAVTPLLCEALRRPADSRWARRALEAACCADAPSLRIARRAPPPARRAAPQGARTPHLPLFI